MSHYDQELANAKHEWLKVLGRNGNITEIVEVVDRVNRAWDALTDALVRQRKERDEEILRLLDMLAESRKRHVEGKMDLIDG